MTTTDYLINIAFAFLVLLQARDRRVDRRALVRPLVALFFVADRYVHSVPTAGNDLVLIGVLTAVGLAFGLVCGFATHLRVESGIVLARVGWLAGVLLVTGICSRIVFAFAVGHGAERAVRSFSIAHHIGAAAWPVALVSMAVFEVVTRLGTVHLRALRLASADGGFRRAAHRSIVSAQ
jgi:hypothetical protein